jgi:flagellar hook assembly protein FlgD
LVRDLLSGDYDKGVHWTSWDGTNRLGQTVASGVYLVTSTLPDQQETCKIAVIK